VEHNALERYSAGDSPVHRLDARVKILLALGGVLAVVTTPPQRLLAFVIYAGLLAWTAALAGVPLRSVAARAALVLPFSALVALGLPFMADGARVRVLGLSLSERGLWILAGAAMKSLLGAAAGILLIASTPFSGLLQGFRGLGLPDLLLDVLALTYRYLFVLAEEAQRLQRAATARGYRPRWLPQAVIVGRMAGTLFLHSYERAERIHGAMRLRGGNGRLPAGVAARFGWSDGLVLAAGAALLAAVRGFAR